MTEGARLIAHKGAVTVTREELKNYPAPEPTETWKPVAHAQLVDTLTQVMADRGMHIEREPFAVQGTRLFGTLRLFPHVTQSCINMIATNSATGWSVHNAVTMHIKDLAPAPAFRAAARLGKFFASKF